jgi:hypothetical protein
MTRFLLIVAALFVLSLPAALAAPPAGKGKPEKPDKPGKSVAAPGQSAEKNAAKKCKAERASMGAEAFKAKYGTNPNKANAFGKCVSGQSKKAGDERGEDEAEDSKAEEAAATKCKAERESMGIEAFKAKHGTNKDKANAFGKCVSKLSKKATS